MHCNICSLSTASSSNFCHLAFSWLLVSLSLILCLVDLAEMVNACMDDGIDGGVDG